MMERTSLLSRENSSAPAEEEIQVALTSEDANLSALANPAGQLPRVIFENYQHVINIADVLADSSDEEDIKPDYNLTSSFQ